MKTNDELFTDWEDGGLPSPNELTPLSQTLISPELASAFSISPSLLSEPPFTVVNGRFAPESRLAFLARLPKVKTEEEQRPSLAVCPRERDGLQGGGEIDIGNSGQIETPAAASQNLEGQREGYPGQGFHVEELSSLPSMHHRAPNSGHELKVGGFSPIPNGLSLFMASPYDRRPENGVEPSVSFAGMVDSGRDGGPVAVRRITRFGDCEESDAAVPAMENSNEEQTARTLKRPRLVWTPQLHKRFVDAVAHLGIKNAVPKTIMQLMNVDGLTRENVASHLQKYRLYLKRMQGLSTEGPSSSDHLFASTPVPPSLVASAQFLASHQRDDSIPLPFVPPVVHVPVPGLGVHAHMSSHINPGGHFAAFDPHALNPFSRAPPQRSISRDQSERSGETYKQDPSSPPRHILTLFPTSSC